MFLTRQRDESGQKTGKNNIGTGTIIIPAIIPRSREHLREMVARLNGVAGEFQIDIVDGVFIPEMLEMTVSYELDLMTVNPLRALPAWLAQHPKSVVLHIESFKSDEEIMKAIEMVRERGKDAVLAALNDTPLERLFAFVPYIDGVQCMGIAEIGRQGNPFDARVIARVRRIRSAYPALSISVDGSVNAETIMLFKEAGANRFVVGSAIFDSADPVGAYKELCALIGV